MTMSRTQLTPDLFFDLIDRRLTAIDICSRHELTFDQLEDVVQSPEFQDAAARLKSVEHTRCTATDTLRRTAALRTLEDIAAQQPSCPTHTETIRLAAAQILRVTRADPIAAEHTPQHADQVPHPDPHPDPHPAPHPPGRTLHPEPEPINGWPDDSSAKANPAPDPDAAPVVNPDTYPDQSAPAQPTPSAPEHATPTSIHQRTTRPAQELITRAGATQPFTPPSIPGRTAAGTTQRQTHKRAPPPQHAA